MRLKIYLPSQIFLDQEVVKVAGESAAGGFCLLPHHIDYVTGLTPGILSYHATDGEQHYLAVDRGILVKQQDLVLIATRHAVHGDLGRLQKEVGNMVSVLDEREKATRSAVARLEAGFMRRFMEFGKLG